MILPTNDQCDSAHIRKTRVSLPTTTSVTLLTEGRPVCFCSQKEDQCDSAQHKTSVIPPTEDQCGTAATQRSMPAKRKVGKDAVTHGGGLVYGWLVRLAFALTGWCCFWPVGWLTGSCGWWQVASLTG